MNMIPEKGSDINLPQMNILIVAIISASVLLLRKTAKKKEPSTKEEDIHVPPFSVPFFYILPSSASLDSDASYPFKDVYRVLEKHKDDCETIISSIILSNEIAIKSEWSIFPDNVDKIRFSTRLEERVKRTAEVLESDYFVLQKLLKPFHLTLALPSPSSFNWTSFQNDSKEKSSAYDSAMQIITHIVRDWSEDGKRSRDSLYHWCIKELMKYGSREGVKEAPVLIPGAGLGRLARDISLVGFDVQANELSLCMSAAAHQFLNGNMTKGYVHPFALDFLTNEVTSTDRYQQIEFTNAKDEFLGRMINDGGLSRGSLSYNIGDFVEIYAQRDQRGRFGAVVTCFFIDTASNIYEYLLVIRNSLKSGGVWINVGPLQWHQNAKLHPSADELRVIIESVGFRIESWSVDNEAINYRHDDTNEEIRHTKMEGYRPLRFVATLPRHIRHSLREEDAALKIMNMRNNISPTQTRSEAQFQSSPKNTTSNVTITELS
jgi:hypothetical protein